MLRRDTNIPRSEHETGHKRKIECNFVAIRRNGREKPVKSNTTKCEAVAHHNLDFRKDSLSSLCHDHGEFLSWSGTVQFWCMQRLTPPSTKIVCPVMKAAAGEHRKAVRAEISSGVPKRLAGVLFRACKVNMQLHEECGPSLVPKEVC